MAVVAGVANHIRQAEDLMSQAHDTVGSLSARRQGNYEQMQHDIATVGALGSLATAHIAMASFLQMRNDS